MRFGWCAPDAGFFDQQLLGFLRAARVVLHRGGTIDAVAETPGASVTQWGLGRVLRAGEFFLQLYGWDRPRRFVVIREQLRAERHSLGRKCWMFWLHLRVFVTNLPLPEQEIWRDYTRADMEKSHSPN